jgi:hypothetical protein
MILSSQLHPCNSHFLNDKKQNVRWRLCALAYLATHAPPTMARWAALPMGWRQLAQRCAASAALAKLHHDFFVWPRTGGDR